MYTAPTRAEIDAQIIASIEGQLGQTVTIFPKAFVRVLSKALSAVLSLAYQFIAWAIRQIFPATSDAESLSYYGDWYAMPRAAATSAILQITISGDDPTAIPAGTLWAYGSLVFTQAADVVISSGTASAQIQALAYGIAGNLPPSTVLFLPSPKAGVTGAVVAAVSTAAVDEEPLDLWRSRIVQRMQNQPQGGATGDYIRWAMEVAGIAGAHVKKIGTDVYLYPLAALTGSARIPDAPKLAEVQTYLQDPIRRPLCATVYASAPVSRTVSLSISGLSPADANTKANITAGVSAYLYAAYPKQYSDEAAPTNLVSLAAIWGIIIANGAVATGVTMTVSGIGAGVQIYDLPIGEIADPGVITWA